MGLLAAEITARTRHDPSRLYDSVTADLGTSFYQRIDAPATTEQKKLLANLNPERFDARELGGEPIEVKLTRAPGNNQPIGGIKVVAENGWFAARPSGTEEIYKIYAESFRSEDHLKQIQGDAQTAISRLFKMS
jgi:phosphoglucomutase